MCYYTAVRSTNTIILNFKNLRISFLLGNWEGKQSYVSVTDLLKVFKGFKLLLLRLQM